MNTWILRVLSVLTVIGGSLAGTVTVAAQERSTPAPAVEFSAGAFSFPDDSVVTEGFVGGGARFYLLPRLGVGPEIAYVHGNNHSHMTLTGNLTVDLVAPLPDGSSRAVTPFVVAGGGLFQSRGPVFVDFNQRKTESFYEGAFTAGGGVRARVGDRVYVGGEARIGWELHLRFNGFVGVHLGR